MNGSGGFACAIVIVVAALLLPLGLGGGAEAAVTGPSAAVAAAHDPRPSGEPTAVARPAAKRANAELLPSRAERVIKVRSAAAGPPPAPPPAPRPRHPQGVYVLQPGCLARSAKGKVTSPPALIPPAAGKPSGLRQLAPATPRPAKPSKKPTCPAAPSTGSTVAGPPASVVAVPGNGSARVSWKAPARNGGSKVTRYLVTAYPGDATVASSATHATIGGLRNGISYTFTVTATNSTGTGMPSAPSNPVAPIAATATPAASTSPQAATAAVPGAPTDVAGEPRDSAVTVTWTAPDDGGSPITSYTVTASPGGISDTVEAPTTSDEIGNLDNGTAYTFTVTATNAIGAGPASAPTASVTPAPATYPDPVTDLQVTPGNTQATVSWQMPANDGGADLTNTFIELFTAEGSYVGYTDVAAPATTATLTGLTDGTAYYVAVSVENSSFYESDLDYSDYVFTPQAGPQPAPPASVSVHAGNTQATVTWTAPSQDGGSPVTGYVVTTYDDTDSVVGTPVTTGADAASATVTGLDNGSEYYFGVAAENSAGTGPALFTDTITPAGTPGAPAGVTLYPSNGAVFASWTAPSDDGGSPVTAYTVVATGPSGAVAEQTTPATSALVSGLTNGTSYTVTVTAANDATAGSASAPSAPAAPAAQDLAPAGLTQVPPDATLTDPQPVIQEDSVISGNGRYVFDLNDNGITRYDTVSGHNTVVSIDSSGNAIPVFPDLIDAAPQPGASFVSSSYNGNIVAFIALGPDGNNQVYLRDISAGTTALVSRNDANGPTNGNVLGFDVSADGSAVFFGVNRNTDMASRSSCATQNLYRYDVAAGSIAWLNPTPSLPANLPEITGITCASPNFYLAASANGDQVAVEANLTYQCSPCSNASVDDFGAQGQIVVIGANAGGATSAKWYTGLMGSVTQNGISELFVTAFEPNPKISYDGSSVFAQVESYDGGSSPDPDGSLVKLSLSAFTALPSLDDPLPAFFNLDAVSGSGAIAITDFSYADAQGNNYDQVFAVDMAAGGIAPLSQFGGALGNGVSGVDAGGIDGTGNLVTFGTGAPNLLGLPAGAGGTSYNIVVVDLGGLVSLATAGTEGCKCANSLGATAPLQDLLGDPVNTGTGAFTDTADDGGVTTPGVSFDMRRSYNSDDTTASPLGQGWSMPYQMSLSVAATGDVTLTAEDGSQGVFSKAPDGTYQSGPGVDATLTATSSGYTVTLPTLQTDTFSSSGQLTAMTDRSGQGLTFHYTGTQLTSVTDASGGTSALTYGSSGQLAGVQFADGRSVGYSYDSTGLLSAVTGVNGGVIRYAYDAAGRLTTVTDPDGNVVTSNTYDAAGRVTGQVTNNGANSAALSWDSATQVATYTSATGGVTTDYYAGNVLVKHVDPDHGVTTYDYDRHLNLTSVTDPDGNTTTMTYDPAGHLLTRSAPATLGYTESWTYDGNGNVLTYTDGLGNSTTSTYDSGNRLLTKTDPAGAKTSYTYTSAGQVATVTDPDGGVWKYSYNAAGDLISTTDPLGNVTTATYDSTGRMLTETSPLGNAAGADAAAYTTTYTYDPQGDLLTKTDPLAQATTYGYDPDGNLLSKTDPTGATTSYTYDGTGHVLTVTSPAGGTTRYTYDGDGHQTSATDALGDKTTWTHDPAGLVASTVSPRGNAAGANPAEYTTTYTYNGDGRQTAVTDPLGNTTATGYDAAGRPVTSTDPLGRVTRTAYDADGNTLSVADGAGDTKQYTYDMDGRVLTVTDPVGGTTAYTYDAAGNKLSATAPLGEEATWTYDADGRVRTMTDPRGNAPGATAAAYTTTYSYDANGNLVKRTDPLGRTTSYGYDADGNETSVTDPGGGTTGYSYDGDSREITVTDPLNHKTTTGYTSTGNLASVTDPSGAMTTYGYNVIGQRTSVIAPDGNVTGSNPAAFTTTYEYDADGNQTKVTGPTGAVTTTGYDSVGRPVTVTDPDGGKTVTGYNADGEVVSVTDPSGGVVASSYDAAGRLTGNTDALGNTTTYGYDANGDMTAQTSPLGEETTWSYDLDRRMASETSPLGNEPGGNPNAYTSTYGYDAAGNQNSAADPLGDATTTTYDAGNRVTSVTDALGNATQYGYDANGKLTSVTSPAGAVTKYTVDAGGNTTAVTDANGNTTSLGYDPDNRLASVTDPLGGKDTASYDASGNRVSATDARGITATTSFDARGLPLSVSYTDATPVAAFSYDAAGRLTGQTDGSGSYTLGYDSSGRLTSVGEPSGGSFGYAYNAAGDITSRTYPDGTVTGYGYDADGRDASATTGGNATGYGYDANGNLTRTTLPAGGYAETRSYDAADRLTGITAANPGGTLSSYRLTLNADGQPASAAASQGGTASTTYYTYNKDSWLTSACATSGCPAGADSTTYSYDPVGNLLTQGSNGQTTNYAYNAANELTSATTGSGVQNFSYDADGNYTGDGTAADVIGYDANNKPATATIGGNSYAFTFDAHGNRTSTAENGAPQGTEVWDINNPLPKIATVLDGSGSLVADYTYDPLGDPQSETTPNGTSYDTHDWLGSVTSLLSSAGVDQVSNSYTATGAETTTDLVGSPPPDQFGYAGQYNDPALSGLVDMGAREYSPATGTFTTRDPVTQPATDPYISPYSYAANDPVTQTDPSGDTPQAPGADPLVPSGSFLGGSKPRHDFAVRMAYDQLVTAHGTDKVYAALGAGTYGPIGRLLQLPSGGRHGGQGEPDIVVKDASIESAAGSEPAALDGSEPPTGWWVYEVKPATEAGENGVVLGGIEYNGRNALDQIDRYILGMQAKYPGELVQAGPPIKPDAAYNAIDRSIEAIFSANEWNTYGPSYPAQPLNTKMDGIIFYTNFRPTRNKEPSKSFAKAQPTIEKLMEDSGNGNMTVNEFLESLMANNAVPTASASCGPSGSSPGVPWTVIGVGSAGAGIAGYMGYQAWQNRAPSWLSDESIEQFLEAQQVPVESVTGAAATTGGGEIAAGAAVDSAGLLDVEALAGGEVLDDLGLLALAAL